MAKLGLFLDMADGYKMKVLVCGSIGYGGIDTIRDVQKLLTAEGFEIVDQLSEDKGGLDYSSVRDFRDKRGLSKRIAKHDLKRVEESDALVVVPNGASYGTAIEMYEAKKAGKEVVVFGTKKIPSPWPIYLSTTVVTTKKALIETLNEYQAVLDEKKQK